jgi:hypothetical protein
MPLRRKNMNAEVKKLVDHEMLFTMRTRFTAADLVVAPGTTLLPAFPNASYRLVDLMAIANGGAAGGLTNIIVSGTVGAVKTTLATLLPANLTQSALLRLGATGAAPAANGVTLQPMDPSTSIMIERTGTALTGATSIDVIATYALEGRTVI